MTLGRADLRHFAYDHPVIGPALGFYGVATSITGTSVTDPEAFGDSNYGGNHFAGKGLVILPNRNGADQAKAAGTKSGSVLTIADATAYAGSYQDEPYEFLMAGRGAEAITFDRLNKAAQNALRRIYFDTRAAVSQLWADGDLNSPDMDAWVASSSISDITIEKSDAAPHNRPGGLYSVLATYNAAGMYFSSTDGYDAQAGDQLWIAAMPILLTSGTATLKAWDTTNNVQLGQTLSVSGKGAFHMGMQVSPTRACNVNLRAGADEDMEVAWDCFPSHDLNGMNWEPPDWIDANWKLYRLEVMHYGREVALGVQNANTAQPEAWQPRVDYTTANLAEDASPNLIQLMRNVHRTLPARDLFYYGRRRESDRAELADEAETTNADRDFLEAAFLSEVCALLEARDTLGPNGTWRTLQRGFDATVEAQRRARVQTAPQPRQIRRVVKI